MKKRFTRRTLVCLALALITALSLAGGYRTVAAESTDAKVLIWSTKESPVEMGGNYESFAVALNRFFSNNGTAVAGYAGLSSVSATLQADRNTERHFTENQDLSGYSMVIVFMPYIKLNDNDVKVLQNYLNAGGRVLLQAEWNKHCATANREMTRVAGLLGATFTITNNDNAALSYYDVNTGTDVMEGTNLAGNLYRNCFADISYSGYVQRVLYVGTQTAMVDMPAGKGRITAVSDMDWWYGVGTDTSKKAAACDLWGRLLKNSIANMEKVKEGGNPNHEHTWAYSCSGNVITATCTCAVGTERCDYSAIAAGAEGRKVTLTLNGATSDYTGSAVKASVTKADKFPVLVTESDIIYYTDEACTVKTTAANSGAAAEGKAPVKVGTYTAAVTAGGYTAKASVKINSLSGLTVTAPTAVDFVYDGTAHGGAAVPGMTGATVTYSVDGGESYTAEVPQITDAGELDVIAKATLANYADATCGYTLKVTPRAVTLTSESATKVYDGTPLTKHAVSIADGSFISGESFSSTCKGSQTDVGSCNNVFTYTLTGGAKAGNYDITTQYGILTVTAEEGKNLQPNPEDLQSVVKEFQKENPDSSVEVLMIINRTDVTREDKTLLKPYTDNKQAIYYSAKLYAVIDGTRYDIGDSNDILIDVTSNLTFEGRDNFEIYRVHNGEVDELTETPNDDGECFRLDKAHNKVIVTANKYSAFAIVYEGKSPKTGDDDNLYIFSGIALATGVGLCTVAMLKRKKREN